MSKPNQLIDAVKTATDIHNGDYSSLRGKSFLIIDNSDKIKKKRHSGDKPVKKSRLDKIEESINNLTNLTMQMNARFDNLEKDVKDINVRIDRIESRLDYNSLQIERIQKRLDYYGLQIEGIQKRLDYNGLQIEGIQKRLDYNGLKKLPNA